MSNTNEEFDDLGNLVKKIDLAKLNEEVKQVIEANDKVISEAKGLLDLIDEYNIKVTEMAKDDPKLLALRDAENKEWFKKLLSDLAQVKEKDQCMRVRFLDKLANVFQNWATGIREYNAKTPVVCAIKLKSRDSTDKTYSSTPAPVVTDDSK